MLKTIDSFHFKNLADYGARYLENNINVINDLNVFPVPDGDTGTNMVLTVKNGLASIKDKDEELPSVAKAFGEAVIFGARGNSGVIFSQFLKGVCERLQTSKSADPSLFCEAVANGVKFAYGAVAQPVEGTILTVIREAAQAVEAEKDSYESIDDVVTSFLINAKTALDKTTDMLPVLQKAGVVDSGGAGLVCFFEGISKYLKGETIEIEAKADSVPAFVDYSVFNKTSRFEFGYCTELLIQLQDCKEELDINEFRNSLNSLGDSLVTSYESDKLRVHIHTQTPERILEYCHKYGEFLSLKIENMSVQHTQREPKIMLSDNDGDSAFATIAVAPNKHLANTFIDMGADVVMLNESCPSTEDFIEAYEQTEKDIIIIFPNDPDSILAARQAAEFYKKSEVTVIDCDSVTDCYSALAILNYDCVDLKEIIETINETIDSIYSYSIMRSSQGLIYGGKTIDKNNYYAATNTDVLFIGDTLYEVAVRTVNDTLAEYDYCVISLFYGQNVTEEEIDLLIEQIKKAHPFIEISTLPTDNVTCDLTISFE